MFEIGITARELVLTEPAATISTQWRWVYALKHQVVLLVNHIRLRAGIAAPQHIHQVLAVLCQCLYSGIGKLLPTQRRVTVGLMGTNRERSIQQQHALLGPTGDIARCGDRCTKVGLNLLEDILQRGRKLNTVLNRETQSVGLSWLVIGVLTDNHYLYLVERTQVKGIKYQFAWRIAGSSLILLSHSLSKLRKVRLFKLATKVSLPRFLYLYCHILLKFGTDYAD